MLFGHHFAAIAGAGPLVGPVLAAQMGYLPGTLWILFGVVLAGAVQDFMILFLSLRRDGRSLGDMIRTEIGPAAGVIAMIGILLIMMILLAVLALVVVKALAISPWGTFTVAMTIPIALLMGVYLRYLRPGRMLEVSIIGLVLLMLSIWLGGHVAADPAVGARASPSTATTLAWMLIGYGFVASVLPVWLLLAPRDYLSHLPQDRHGGAARGGDPRRAAGPADAGADAVRRRHRAGVLRHAVPVPVHHHRLRRGVRLALADLLGHHAEDARQRSATRADRLRRHADGVLRRGDGADRRLRAAARRVLRDELAGGGDRHRRASGRARRSRSGASWSRRRC